MTKIMRKMKIKISVVSKDEVNLSGTQEGLLWLARRLESLANDASEGHIHVEDEGEILSQDSLRFSICLMNVANDRIAVGHKCKKWILAVLLGVHILLFTWVSIKFFHWLR